MCGLRFTSKMRQKDTKREHEQAYLRIEFFLLTMGTYPRASDTSFMWLTGAICQKLATNWKVLDISHALPPCKRTTSHIHSSRRFQ